MPFPEISVIAIRLEALSGETGILSEFRGDYRLASAGASSRTAARARRRLARRRRAARDLASYRHQGKERGRPRTPVARALRLDRRASGCRIREPRGNPGYGEREARAAPGSHGTGAPRAQGGNLLAGRALVAAGGARLPAPCTRRARTRGIRGASPGRAASRHRLRGVVPRHADPDERLDIGSTLRTPSGCRSFCAGVCSECAPFQLEGVYF